MNDCCVFTCEKGLTCSGGDGEAVHGNGSLGDALLS